jgi:hypothetical protein
MFAYIKEKQARSPVWQTGTVNCTGFISDVASYMGLRTPALPTLMYPEDLVKKIKELNGGRQEMASYTSAHWIAAFTFMLPLHVRGFATPRPPMLASPRAGCSPELLKQVIGVGFWKRPSNIVFGD